MKQHQKWLNGVLSAEGAKRFESETRDVNTFDQFIDIVSETAWRGALEWVKKEAISLDERGDISRGIINRELEDE